VSCATTSAGSPCLCCRNFYRAECESPSCQCSSRHPHWGPTLDILWRRGPGRLLRGVGEFDCRRSHPGLSHCPTTHRPAPETPPKLDASTAPGDDSDTPRRIRLRDGPLRDRRHMKQSLGPLPPAGSPAQTSRLPARTPSRVVTRMLQSAAKIDGGWWRGSATSPTCRWD
jgi:hypothetical protein